MLIATDLACAVDPVRFAERCGVTPDPWQAGFLRSRAKRSLQLAARQVGKTEVTALRALHTALYESGALTLVIAPSERQSKEFVRRASIMYRRLDHAVRLRADSVTKLEFENDSRILALPGGEEGKTIRGLAGARLIIVDEAALVLDDLIAVVRPMMATNPEAELIALSTPAGKRGWFYDAWTGGDPVWSRTKITVDMCPRITSKFLAEERKALGQTKFESEYGLIFHDSEMSAFSSEIIDAAFSTEVLPLWL